MSSSSPLLSLALTGSLLLALACTGDPESPEVSAPPSAQADAPEKSHVKKGPLVAPGGMKASSLGQGLKVMGPAKGTAYAQVKVTCCTNARVNRVLDRALELHLALVAEKGVSGAMDALAVAARDAEKEGALEPASLAAVVAIAESAEAAKGGGLAEQRLALLQVGRQLDVLIPAHAGGARDLAKAKDPASGDAWFQREGSPKNPFGGTGAEFTK